MDEFPRSLATVVGSVLGSHYYSHRKIEALLYECGASGDPPAGNCEEKITGWLLREARDDTSKAFQILGKTLEDFMDSGILCSEDPKIEGRKRIQSILQRHGLEYRPRGRIFGASVGPPSRALEDILRERSLPEVNEEFERATGSVNQDPAAAVAAACCILESLCKVYLEDEGLPLPHRQTVGPLWSAVSKHLGLSVSSMEDADLRRILGGLASVVDGIGAYRTHASSAHGRGRRSYRAAPRHARLAVHAAHSLAVFLIETWDQKKATE
ncbi:MAG TPA: abortive infection family protein [Sumerlaeia bacterium]|nr:abortive infection family protein [Sumerlaeia bacterium]